MLNGAGGQEVGHGGLAFACGFDNPGHFAGDYRLAFGELPSQTLTKVKGPAYQSYTKSWGTRIETAGVCSANALSLLRRAESDRHAD